MENLITFQKERLRTTKNVIIAGNILSILKSVPSLNPNLKGQTKGIENFIKETLKENNNFPIKYKLKRNDTNYIVTCSLNSCKIMKFKADFNLDGELFGMDYSFVEDWKNQIGLQNKPSKRKSIYDINGEKARIEDMEYEINYPNYKPELVFRCPGEPPQRADKYPDKIERQEIEKPKTR